MVWGVWVGLGGCGGGEEGEGEYGYCEEFAHLVVLSVGG